MIFENVRFLNESKDTFTWKYIKDLDCSLFNEIEEEYNFKFPYELKSLFNNFNGGHPDRNLFKVNNVERVFGSLLSLDDEDGYSIRTPLYVFKKEGYDNYIPFGTDPAGNIISYNTNNKNIEFWNHETGEFEFIAKDLKSFLNSLYK